MNNLARIPPRPENRSGSRWYNYIEQWLAALSAQLWSLERRIPQIPNPYVGSPYGGPTEPLVFVLPGGGEGGTGAGSGNTVALVTLDADLYRDQTISGIVLDTGEEVIVDGLDTHGYFFEGVTIPCLKDPDGVYIPVCSGSTFITGTLSGSLSSGGTASLTIDDSGGQTVTVYGKFGAVNSGKKIGATWSDFSKRWQVNTAEC